MHIPLPTPFRKYLFLFVSFVAVSFYVHWCSKAWLAARAANPASFPGLTKAVHLQPGDANYHYLLGRYHILISQSPQLALPSFLQAASLNPHRSDYWFSLATIYEVLGDPASEKFSLERAIHADPTTPTVAWEAANFYLAQGDVDQALREFNVVLKSGSYRIPDSIRLCWQAKPDAEYLVRSVLPPNPDVYFTLLDYLVSIRQNAPAAQVWAHLVQLNQPVERSRVLEYVRVLLASQDVTQAMLVWQQAANLADLAAYQPSPDNLIINGDFSLDILNAGFGWRYDEVPGVELALDPTQSRSGRQSLSISYDSANLSDSGLSQQIPVQPNNTYEFSANFKAPDIQGAGGPQFLIMDAGSGKQYFASDDLKDADFWKQISGTFTTGPDARLLILRIQRVPSQSPIRGKLWIDGLRLKPQSPSTEKAGAPHE
ncbi:MAG: carbohydrate binding domain-containing protein [Terriglobales bacterium]|jgi:tetratricopeptide (TPR) repeat protein